MKEIENIQIDSRNQYSALKWGILILIYGIVVQIIFKIGAYELIKPMKYIDIGLISLVGITYISLWIVRIVVIWQIVKIAGKLNRDKLFWAFFALITPPFALIIISFQDYKIENERIKKILDSMRLDYNAELVHLKNTLDVSHEEFAEIEINLKNKYNSELLKKISEKETYSFSATDNIQPDENIATEENEEEFAKCPACNSDIDPETIICPECGLTLK